MLKKILTVWENLFFAKIFNLSERCQISKKILNYKYSFEILTKYSNLEKNIEIFFLNQQFL